MALRIATLLALGLWTSSAFAVPVLIEWDGNNPAGTDYVVQIDGAEVALVQAESHATDMTPGEHTIIVCARSVWGDECSSPLVTPAAATAPGGLRLQISP